MSYISNIPRGRTLARFSYAKRGTIPSRVEFRLVKTDTGRLSVVSKITNPSIPAVAQEARPPVVEDKNPQRQLKRHIEAVYPAVSVNKWASVGLFEGE